MKNFIITMSIVGLMAILICYQSDFNKFIYENERVRNLVDQAAIEISYHIDKAKYGEGYVVFDRESLTEFGNKFHEALNKDYFKGGYRLTMIQYNENNTKFMYISKTNNASKKLIVDRYIDNSYNVGTYVVPKIYIEVIGYKVKCKNSFLDKLNLRVRKVGTVIYEGH